jgi:NADH-quinone oxidoreductase subunit J
MTPMQLIFIITAVTTLGAALMVVTTKNLVHAALWLILTLFGVAVFFVLLSAGFLAVAQVVIYIGAISILMIFAIMLTRRIAQERRPQVNANWWVAALISLVMFGGVAYMLGRWPGFSTQAPELSAQVDPLRELGQALVSPNAYVLPFEVASVLLLAALVGAIMVAWERN